MTTSNLLSVALLLALAVLLQPCSSSPSAVSSLRILSGQNPHAACTIDDLANYCPDESVDHTTLVAECEGTHGLPAVKCYMRYLCENHDQQAVNGHKECIDGECPLAKRMPPLNCEKFLNQGETPAVDNENENENDSTPVEEDDEEQPVETETATETPTETISA